MANQLRTNRKVQLLLDLMELGLPSNTPLSFLGKPEQQRLREITVAMEEDEASEFAERLMKPPVDNKLVIDSLSLAPNARGGIVPLARRLILQKPSLVFDGVKLTALVIQNWE